MRDLEELEEDYRLPSLDLLKAAPPSPNAAVDKASLERNARLLENVLDDFKVKGSIVEVRPGPVVTMYELEPESGVKASLVIALADDIARNMSAISARVATIPGRSVIGIELPNARREGVNLHELVASQNFEDQSAQLPIILGKNIAGDPVIADLAPMPHLLIAGTTGSGKSVGLNCMILSLLYRLTPKQCKMIMIDPKMLELSMYEDIPHLLAPVVTQPAKAVRALKWAVEQMEDRYRMMASVGVRSLAGFNDKVSAARAEGKPLGRKVQTGYHPETGQPVYEEEQLDYQGLPQIVVVVDELADIVDELPQDGPADHLFHYLERLSTNGAVAGIHLILASNRWNDDNLELHREMQSLARIAYHLNSKEESEAFLNVEGAQQLYRPGDLLYRSSFGPISRVHSPIITDDEILAVANHWRSQGAPEYISSINAEADGSFAPNCAPIDEDSPEAEEFHSACQLVAESRKASTSWLQRQLRVGYNSAARLIERMEEEGLVSRPDRVGRREVLMDRDGQSSQSRPNMKSKRKKWWQS